MRLPKLVATGAVALTATCAVALAQPNPPEGRVYVFHSAAQGGCPALDWHVTVGPNSTLSGMIAWNNMQSMARATGTASGGKVQMTATEVGGRHRTATVNGIIQSNGFFTVNITGPNVSCQNINIPFFTPPPAGSG